MGKRDSSGGFCFVVRINFQFLSARMFGWSIKTAALGEGRAAAGLPSAGPVRPMFNDWSDKLRAFWRNQETQSRKKGRKKVLVEHHDTTIMKRGCSGRPVCGFIYIPTITLVSPFDFKITRGKEGERERNESPNQEKVVLSFISSFLSCTSRSLPFDRQSRRRKIGLTEKVKLLFSIATLLLIGLLILVRLSLTIRLSMMALLNWGLL